MKKILASSLAAATLLLSAACGGSDAGGDRPSTAEISTSLQGSKSLLGPLKVDKPAADCLAEVLSKSDLSDESLTALVKGDQNYKSTDEGETDVLQGLVKDISTCTKPAS